MFEKANAKKFYYYLIDFFTKKMSKMAKKIKFGFFGVFWPKFGILDHFEKLHIFWLKPIYIQRFWYQNH